MAENDTMLAALLGDAPTEPIDPGFRLAVFARVAAHARRRAALLRAANCLILFSLIGLAAAWLSSHSGGWLALAEPALAVALGVLLAAAGVYGPKRALARARAWVHP